MRSEQPSVFIVILNWNGLENTLHCLEELKGLEYGTRRVIVVDNGSSDGSPDAILAKHPGVTLIRNQANLGYTGGCNVGMRFALQHGADYMWLLNNDAVVTPRSLATLVESAERNLCIGLVSPVVRFHDEPDEIQFAGVLLDPLTEDEAHIKLRATGDPEWPGAWSVLVGTALLIKATVVRKIGYLDDRYFAYLEDWDYSVRAHDAGFDVLVERAATVLHKPMGSMGQDSPMKEYYMVRNRYIFWRSHLYGKARLRYPIRYLGWVLERALISRRRGKEPLVGAAFDGAWGALTGRTGQRPADARMPTALSLLCRTFLVWRPHMWIMLLQGQLRAVVLETFRRTFGFCSIKR